MIASVRESKARLSELIAKATAGEEVVITVRGKPTIQLVPVSGTPVKSDFNTWAQRRKKSLEAMPEGSDSSSEILDDLREDRF
ncbi:MAG: type II toxin-antitoxin system prevent-host-death family antitoxin [Verrucomicrobia bacterium]|nr:type II toxin-antitoxin system prevent-host-death family antitoxin [Verrucomicrobiota bacterium]